MSTRHRSVNAKKEEEAKKKKEEELNQENSIFIILSVTLLEQKFNFAKRFGFDGLFVQSAKLKFYAHA